MAILEVFFFCCCYSSFSPSPHLSLPFPFSHYLTSPLLTSPHLSSPLLSSYLTITFPLLPSILIQHQRAPLAPAGWPLASHFLSCSPAIQRWRAPSGLSRPQGVHQKPPLGAHRRFLLILESPQNGAPLSWLLSDGPTQQADKAKSLGPPPPPHISLAMLRLSSYFFSFFVKHVNSSLQTLIDA